MDSSFSPRGISLKRVNHLCVWEVGRVNGSVTNIFSLYLFMYLYCWLTVQLLSNEKALIGGWKMEIYFMV